MSVGRNLRRPRWLLVLVSVALAATAVLASYDAHAAYARKAQARAVAIAEAACASAGIKHPARRPEVTLAAGGRWAVTWRQRPGGTVLAFVDTRSWESKGCTTIGVYPPDVPNGR